ncbi:MAG: DUF4258 domain-containing protein [Candidatus Woesearchaeota archaeon]
MAIYFSKHARERMVARGIITTEVTDALTRGSKQFQEPDKVVSYYRYFCVVYKKVGNDYVIITVKPR